MRRLWRPGALAAVAVELLLPGNLSGQAYRVGPPPSWVQTIPVPPAAGAAAGAVTEGSEMLLVDQQEAVEGGQLERFRHVAYRLLDEGAVQNRSQIEIVFDSSYQQLTLHSVTVQRDGASIDQLKPDRIRVAQREKELEYQVYDGSLSVVLLLEDVRRGDVVEFSYTRRGANPVFAGHYTSEFALQQSTPLRRIRYRLLWPAERPLFVRRLNTALAPVLDSANGFREYVWDRFDVPGRVLEPDLPSWYDPFPTIQVSDFASWSQVAAWGDSLFPEAPAPPELSGPLARIRAAGASTEGRVRAALRFAQDEVRYLGVEMGVNSHQPFPPATVLRRRYGDCKDKSLLLVTMLRALGVSARPALVSTEYHEHIRDFHPTSSVFDHAIVRAEFGGRVHWLDPSALYQRDDLAGLTPPFGAALVLGSGSGVTLSTLPPRPAPSPLTDIQVRFELGDVGTPAAMRVETTYRGSAADAVRGSLRTTSIKELQRSYEDFYATDYPSARSEAVPQVVDDEATNVLHTTERYTIPEFWHRSRTSERFVGTFYASELSGALLQASGSKRAMPIRVKPAYLRLTIEAHMPAGWDIAPEDTAIESPGFRFAFHVQALQQVLTLRYEYQTLADHVAAAQAGDHIGKMSQVERLASFTVVPPDSGAGTEQLLSAAQLNWPVLLAAVLALGLWGLAAVRVTRMPAAALPLGSVPVTPSPAGLGGWLILVGIGVSLTPLAILSTLVRSAHSYTASTWARLTTPGALHYHVLWAPVLLFELIANLGLLVFTGLQLWLFFRRKRAFPRVFVTLLVARAAIAWVDAVMAQGIPALQSDADPWVTPLRMTLIAVAWGWYAMRSRRVRNTFVN